ncbi:Transposase [hydrothermal vent metagenome]|uniref:Transposase n=1 Tax=hydrothermal vent metagenome TaxID=652676 RepID=A0A3B0UIE0_9ZZZZ
MRTCSAAYEEKTFAVLYSDQASRPNVPVNVLMGLEILKDGNGWTDEEMYNNFCYNVQVRYALGLHSLDEGHFELRTTYNFRRRLVQYMQTAGENLVEACFEQVTDEQMMAYAVKSGVQRVDSKQIASNIRETTRLQLLVEVMQRTYRMLDAADKLGYADLFDNYIKEKSGKYIYRLKGEKHQSHIEAIGELMAQLRPQLADKYKTDAGYAVLERVFNDHFKLVEREVVVKAGAELAADTLQSPDDLEATFRKKRGEGHVGYVVNVTETVDPEQGLQLISKVQTESNSADDAQMLNEALPDLVERTELEMLYTDGTYSSPAVDATCQEQGVTQTQTGIRGSQPDPDTPTLSNFSFQLNQQGEPEQMFCPHGQRVNLPLGRKEGRFIARVAESVCPLCAAQDKREQAVLCLVRYFSIPQLTVALRRQRLATLLASGSNPRAAVEATVRELTCRFGNAKLRVRGCWRVSMTMLASAAMCNARRIWRFKQSQLAAKNIQETTLSSQSRHLSSSILAGTQFWVIILPIWRYFAPVPIFGQHRFA